MVLSNRQYNNGYEIGAGYGSQTRFGQFYRGGTYVPAIAINLGPNAGQISSSQINGSYVYKSITATVTLGSSVHYITVGKGEQQAQYYLGYDSNYLVGAFGSASLSFSTYYGTSTLRSCFFDDYTGYWYVAFQNSSGLNGDDDYTYYYWWADGGLYAGNAFGVYASSRNQTNNTGAGNRWRIWYSGNTYTYAPISNFTLHILYYG